jgi:hypothetical protein
MTNCHAAHNPLNDVKIDDLEKMIDRLECLTEELRQIVIAAVANRDGPIAGSFG